LELQALPVETERAAGLQLQQSWPLMAASVQGSEAPHSPGCQGGLDVLDSFGTPNMEIARRGLGGYEAGHHPRKPPFFSLVRNRRPVVVSFACLFFSAYRKSGACLQREGSTIATGTPAMATSGEGRSAWPSLSIAHARGADGVIVADCCRGYEAWLGSCGLPVLFSVPVDGSSVKFSMDIKGGDSGTRESVSHAEISPMAVLMPPSMRIASHRIASQTDSDSNPHSSFSTQLLHSRRISSVPAASPPLPSPVTARSWSLLRRPKIMM
jgi:hypothetical protein